MTGMVKFGRALRKTKGVMGIAVSAYHFRLCYIKENGQAWWVYRCRRFLVNETDEDWRYVSLSES